MRIKSVKARQIINAKGHPTIEVEVSTSRNSAYSSVPIASTKSRYEYYDAYDNDLTRFHGETLDNIVDNVNRVIGPELIGKNSMDQEDLDSLLLNIDNTIERTHLGVNTITATSQAIAKLGAMESDLPLYKYIRVLHDFSEHSGHKLHSDYLLPIPVITVYKSSSHDRKNALPAQEIMLYPKTDISYQRDLVKIFEFLNAIEFDDNKHSLKSFLKDLSKLIGKSKVKFEIGVDMAASKYKRSENDNYVISNLTQTSTPFKGGFKKLLNTYLGLINDTKVRFLEDFFGEDDYSAWKDLLDEAVSKDNHVQVVSDDFTATSMERLEKVAILESVNNVVIKPSQAGTVTEVINFASRARKYGLNITGSYRHGETEDTFITDLSVGIGAEFLRVGYFKGSEHIAKLNRLVQIEQSL